MVLRLEVRKQGLEFPVPQDGARRLALRVWRRARHAHARDSHGGWGAAAQTNERHQVPAVDGSSSPPYLSLQQTWTLACFCLPNFLRQILRLPQLRVEGSYA